MSAQIISKAATYLTITSRKELNINQRKLQERVEYLEERTIEDKKEFQQQKIHQETRISEMESERNEAYKNEKVSQERLKLVQEEHTRALAKMKIKYEGKVNDLESQLN